MRIKLQNTCTCHSTNAWSPRSGSVLEMSCLFCNREQSHRVWGHMQGISPICSYCGLCFVQIQPQTWRPQPQYGRQECERVIDVRRKRTQSTHTNAPLFLYEARRRLCGFTFLRSCNLECKACVTETVEKGFIQKYASWMWGIHVMAGGLGHANSVFFMEA